MTPIGDDAVGARTTRSTRRVGLRPPKPRHCSPTNTTGAWSRRSTTAPPGGSRVTIYLVRHAKAGERNVWEGDDRLRPLSGRGHLQARGLLDVLEDAQFDRLLSSPYVRCMETVVPLSGRARRRDRTGRRARRRRDARRGARARAQAHGARRGVLHARRRHPDAAAALRESRRRHRRRSAVAEGLHLGARDRRHRRSHRRQVPPAAARLVAAGDGTRQLRLHRSTGASSSGRARQAHAPAGTFRSGHERQHVRVLRARNRPHSTLVRQEPRRLLRRSRTSANSTCILRRTTPSITRPARSTSMSMTPTSSRRTGAGRVLDVIGPENQGDGKREGRARRPEMATSSDSGHQSPTDPNTCPRRTERSFPAELRPLDSWSRPGTSRPTTVTKRHVGESSKG